MTYELSLGVTASPELFRHNVTRGIGKAKIMRFERKPHKSQQHHSSAVQARRVISCRVLWCAVLLLHPRHCGHEEQHTFHPSDP